MTDEAVEFIVLFRLGLRMPSWDNVRSGLNDTRSGGTVSPLGPGSFCGTSRSSTGPGDLDLSGKKSLMSLAIKL